MCDLPVTAVMRRIVVAWFVAAGTGRARSELVHCTTIQQRLVCCLSSARSRSRSSWTASLACKEEIERIQLLSAKALVPTLHRYVQRKETVKHFMIRSRQHQPALHGPAWAAPLLKGIVIM